MPVNAPAPTTIDAVRARFSALQRPLAFFDGPGGTQVPDSVIEAVGGYLRNANANLGGAFETSRRSDELIDSARTTAARFLNATIDEVAFGANMTTLNFALSRTASRDWREGDEIVCTKLDHDGNISPWLELARDRSLTVQFCEVDDECRARPGAPPLAALGANARRRVSLGLQRRRDRHARRRDRARSLHDAGALAWVDAVHYGPHGPIDVAAAGADVLLCSPYKFYGPHLGLAYVRRELAESWRPYKVRPAPDEPVAGRFETGTLAHELLAGFVAAVDYLDDVGWELHPGARARTRAAVPRRPARSLAAPRPADHGRAASRRSP